MVRVPRVLLELLFLLLRNREDRCAARQKTKDLSRLRRPVFQCFGESVRRKDRCVPAGVFSAHW